MSSGTKSKTAILPLGIGTVSRTTPEQLLAQGVRSDRSLRITSGEEMRRPGVQAMASVWGWLREKRGVSGGILLRATTSESEPITRAPTTERALALRLTVLWAVASTPSTRAFRATIPGQRTTANAGHIERSMARVGS